MTTFTGTNGADVLSEDTFHGDTLIGRGGNDTYHCWASSWYDPGFPEYGIPGKSVYYRTDIVEELNRGYDTVYYHIGIHGITVSGAELPSIERIYLVNNLGSTTSTFQLLLGSGAQTVFGSTLGETISGGTGNDTISGASGNDSLTGGGGADSLLGGTGNDTLDGGSGLDRLGGGNGNDAYYLQNAGDIVTELAGGGTDTIHASADCTLPAGVENLVLGVGSIDGTGNGADNWIYDGDGDNALAGGAGVDTASFKLSAGYGGVTASLATGLASGASGSDSLAGFENLEGGYFTDTLQGNSAANRLYGLNDDDSLDGGGGADTLFGGTGDDQYDVDTAGDSVRENIDEGNDEVFSTVSHILRVNVESLTLEGSGNVNGTGNTGNNTLTGNTGNNVLSGGMGLDWLEGSDGNDTLIGGPGKDELNGGNGADRFRFDAAADAWGGTLRDIVQDFTSGVDRIDLSRIDAAPALAGDQAFVVADLHYVSGSGILYADLAGGSVDEFQIQLGAYFHPASVLVADIIL